MGTSTREIQKNDSLVLQGRTGSPETVRVLRPFPSLDGKQLVWTELPGPMRNVIDYPLSVDIATMTAIRHIACRPYRTIEIPYQIMKIISGKATDVPATDPA